MARGRRKDTTLPLSRTLIVQRAYRDRKARYIADLEDRCRKAEEENVCLKEELALARSQSPYAPLSADLAQACSDLMHSLQRAQTALSLFQQRALVHAPESDKNIPSATELDIATVLTHALRQNPPAPLSQQPEPTDTHRSSGDSDDSECCGGVFDCEGLVE